MCLLAPNNVQSTIMSTNNSAINLRRQYNWLFSDVLLHAVFLKSQNEQRDAAAEVPAAAAALALFKDWEEHIEELLTIAVPPSLVGPQRMAGGRRVQQDGPNGRGEAGGDSLAFRCDSAASSPDRRESYNAALPPDPEGENSGSFGNAAALLQSYSRRCARWERACRNSVDRAAGNATVLGGARSSQRQSVVAVPSTVQVRYTFGGQLPPFGARQFSIPRGA